MKIIHGIELKQGSYEELLPDFSPDFPYIASLVNLSKFAGRGSPWHWHKAVELFYLKDGGVEYHTPGGSILFPAGSGGFVNSNVLHMSKEIQGTGSTVSYIHLFDPVLISGREGSLIDQKYVTPLTAEPEIEVIGLYPDNPRHTGLLEMLRESFRLSESDYGYEIRLRSLLSEMWRLLLETAEPSGGRGGRDSRSSEKVKTMMAFIHENCGRKLTVALIAESAFVSERECFRIFHDCLHMTPVEYMTEYRIQKACRMLAGGEESITSICQSCGMGSSSYFGKIFRELMGCSPRQYRLKWRNNDIK